MVRSTVHMSLFAFALAMATGAQAQRVSEAHEAAARRLAADAGAAAEISVHPGTGGAQFVRLAAGGQLPGPVVRARASTDATKRSDARRFLNAYRGLFGITDAAADFDQGRVTKDRLGHSRVALRQTYRGLPVLGGEMKVHFDAADNLSAVSGVFVPDIAVDPRPSRSAAEAAATAKARVLADLGRLVPLRAQAPTLMVYRAGLAQGVEGANHLAWQVTVGNGTTVREFVYVDAHTGKVIDKISGIHEAKNRRAYDAGGATAPGPNYPGSPFWVEGAPLPTGVVEADNMINASGESYDFFRNAFGRESFDGNGATMDAIFNRGNGCPNASWNGSFISFCPGLTTDDVTVHEWAHAYTEYTHGLIYAWQPGALNEAYSDIWGETVDRINGRGGDTPDTLRTADACTAYTPLRPTINITAPAAIAGVRTGGSASFGPQTFGVAATNVVVVNDGAGASTTDGCETPFVNAAAMAGKIAFIDRGVCGFAVKVKNAQNAGAIGVIIGNNATGAAPGMGGTDATITIPALSVTQADGTAIKTQAALTTVTAALARGGVGSDNSVRWLMGEDSTAPGLVGALRDMWNPSCYGNPGKVSEPLYVCGTGDNGGVHSNSGVPNHAYALLVDGGSYNGQVVGSIGLTKAAHIYWRAQSVYQGPASDFAAHASALEQSCQDLTGAALNHLQTGAVSGEVIDASDCQQVAKAILAVELRTPPTQCNFQPLLAQSPPPLCPSGTATTIAADNFDGGRRVGLRWQVSHIGSTTDFTPRNWGVVNGLPGGRPGHAMFAANQPIGTCAAGGDESGLMRLESPEITIPTGASTPRVTFDHWVGTEAGWDGGNLKVSVNGGAWQLIPASRFVYNPYNTTMFSTAQGNTSPLAGQAGFSGADGGSVGGSWGRSIVSLDGIAVAGDKVKLRFELGSDGCGGAVGWYMDDFKVYRCTP